MTAVWRRLAPLELAVAAALSVTFAFLALTHAARASATYDEPVHLASGYAIWRWHDYRINPEHPPLLKCMATLALLALEPWPREWQLGVPGVRPSGEASLAWTRAATAWDQALETGDAQWVFGHTLLYGMKDEALERRGVDDAFEVDPREPPARSEYMNDAGRLLFAARAPMVLLGVLLALAVAAWARRLYGPAAAGLALAMMAFDPNLIAHASLLTTDVGLALLLFGAVWMLWHAWETGSRLALAGSILCAAAAFTAKYSAVLIPPTLLAIVALAPRPPSRASAERPAWRERLTLAAQLVLGVGLAAWLGVWAVHGFRWSAAAPPETRRLPIERELARAEAIADARAEHPDRPPDPAELSRAIEHAKLDGVEALILRASRTGLLPESYVHGFAWVHRKSLWRNAFLRGAYYPFGTWDYFLWSFLLKTPLATLALLAAALAVLVAGRGRRELAFLIVPVAVWFAVGVTSSLNIGHRHLLPIYPFLYVLIAGALARSARVAACLAGVVALSSSFVFAPPWRPVVVHPHELAFFNELAFGPTEGHRFLVDSNLDWGQDLGALRDWLEHEGIREPIGLCYFGMADPRFHGISHIKMPGGYELEPPFGNRARFEDLPLPGYVAISATHFRGPYFSPEMRAAWHEFLSAGELVGVAGRSIFVYRIPARTALNRPAARSSPEQPEHGPPGNGPDPL